MRRRKQKRKKIYTIIPVAVLCGAVVVGAEISKTKEGNEIETVELSISDNSENNTVEIQQIEEMASIGEKTEAVGLSESVWVDRDKPTVDEGGVETTINDINAELEETEKVADLPETHATTVPDSNVKPSASELEACTEPEPVVEVDEPNTVVEVSEPEIVVGLDETENIGTEEITLPEEEKQVEDNPVVMVGSESERYGSLDKMALNPVMPQNAQLRSILDERMPSIVGGCSTNSQKVQAIYDYLINNFHYSRTVKYDYEKDAVVFLTEYKGSCTYYSAAMHYMLLYVGIDNRIVDGYRYPDPSSSRTSFHRWIEINVNGVSYVFDPQWEDTLSGRSGGIHYERFFKTHDEVKKFYVF